MVSKKSSIIFLLKSRLLLKIVLHVLNVLQKSCQDYQHANSLQDSFSYLKLKFHLPLAHRLGTIGMYNKLGLDTFKL